jgi:RNA-directed DNA polymerase
MGRAESRKARPAGPTGREERVKPSGPAGEQSPSPARTEGKATEAGGDLLEKALGRENLLRALRRVEGNRGAAGIDGMGVQELRPYLREHWLELKERLLGGTYRPCPVKRVEIPKPEGGIRKLGIPTVLDRFIQQALLQVLTPVFDPEMSASSYGFRPGRSAHEAVQAAREYIREGRGWVVDLDLKQFFDHVNHDRLMARIARKVKDRRVLRLIRWYLQSGVMEQGVVMAVEEGTPQGGPLSPLLANIYLDDLDKELEKRGHRFCRYADDCNIYVRSRRAGERVMAGVRKFLEGKLKLQVNEAKSAVDRPYRRKFLGFSFLPGKEAKIRLAPQSLRRCKERVREITRRGRSEELGERIRILSQYLEGWVSYFALAETGSVVEDLNKWVRHRLRACVWRQWRRVRTRYRELRALGLSENIVGYMANTRKGPWRIAQSPPLQQGLDGAFWKTHGLLDLQERYQLLRNAWRTAGCGPARPVV